MFLLDQFTRLLFKLPQWEVFNYFKQQLFECFRDFQFFVLNQLRIIYFIKKMEPHKANMKIFAYALIAVQILVVLMYAFFLRPLVHDDDSVNNNYYPMFQDINGMMLIGVGFIMTFIKTHSYSALSYVFFINIIVIQSYLLLAPFWSKVFHGGWNNSTLTIQQMSFTGAQFCVASVLIGFGAVLGRIGALQLLIMGLVGVLGYTLNQQICFGILYVQDVGGSLVTHTFGAYYGLATSFVLGKFVTPKTKPETSKQSITFAMMGTFYLWMYWPSFNAGYFSHSGYQTTIMLINTMIALSGSCIGAFIMSALLRDKFNMQDILNATLAGGVTIGAGAGIFINPAAALSIGLFGGVISTFGFYYLTPKLQQSIGLIDTCGVHNVNGLPGIIGGILSSIAMACYQFDPLTNTAQIGLLEFYRAPYGNRTFYQQGGYQFAGTVISVLLAIVFGFLAGLIMKKTYVFGSDEFYKDDSYFKLKQQDEIQIKLDDTLVNKDTKKNRF